MTRASSNATDPILIGGRFADADSVGAWLVVAVLGPVLGAPDDVPRLGA